MHYAMCGAIKGTNRDIAVAFRVMYCYLICRDRRLVKCLHGCQLPCSGRLDRHLPPVMRFII